LVPDEMERFISWYATDGMRLHPVERSARVHAAFVKIHPFIDGNGRTARLFATFILYLSEFDHRRLFALDNFYDRDRPAYYSALKTVQDNNGDITTWLEYFTTGVAFSVNEVKEAVLKLGAKKKSSLKTQIALSDKQMKIVEFINVHGKATNKDLQGLFKISAQAVHKELAKLVELKVIRPVGAGRSLYYLLE